jgi:hypothetical protein
MANYRKDKIGEQPQARESARNESMLVMNLLKHVPTRFALSANVCRVVARLLVASTLK